MNCLKIFALALISFLSTMHIATAMIIEKNITYVSDSQHIRHKLDIYSPLLHKDTPIDKENLAPIHIFVHGGGWIRGNKDNLKTVQAVTYPENGIILVNINYRLVREDSPFPAMIDDIAAAVRWVKNNIESYGGDKNRIVISGHSAGAHLVALLATDHSYLEKYNLSTTDIKAFIPVDTGSFDLTIPAPQEGEGRLINMLRKRAFGLDNDLRKKASPQHQLSIGTPHKTPISIFTTAERPNAVEATNIFEKALKDQGYNANATIIDEGLKHDEMKDEIFDIESPIFHTIAEFTNN